VNVIVSVLLNGFIWHIKIKSFFLNVGDYKMFWRKKSNEDNINLIEEVSNLKEVVKKQSILIEDLVEENKGLLENYEEVEFNISKLTNKVENNISKLINVIEYNFQEVKDQLNLQNDIDGIPKNDEPETYREYHKTYIKKIPELTLIDNTGKLMGGNGRICKYNMDTLIGLKKDIPDLDLSFNKLAKKYGLSPYNTITLCAGIEYNHYQDLYEAYKNKELPDTVTVNRSVKPYTQRGLNFDGFYFTASTGTYTKIPLFNIVQLSEISDNIDEVNDNLDINVLKYGIKFNRLQKIVKTLKETDIFTNPIAMYNKKPLFEIENNKLKIDGARTGLTVNQMNYIKITIFNADNFMETVENLINDYDHIQPYFIVKCAKFADELPEIKKEPNMIVNNPEKRKELGMGGY